MSESEAEKKRNKLGYQRISIACGEWSFHSRRGDCRRSSASLANNSQQHTVADVRSDVWLLRVIHMVVARTAFD